MKKDVEITILKGRKDEKKFVKKGKMWEEKCKNYDKKMEDNEIGILAQYYL